MALPFDHVKMVLTGNIGGVQSWSIGLTALTAQVVVPGDGLAAFTAALGPKFLEFWDTNAPNTTTAVKKLNASDTFAESLETYFYLGGANTASLHGQYLFANPIPGTSAVVAPASLCAVASLRSPTPSRAGRGRIYVPCTGMELTTGHKIPTANTVAVAAATKRLIDAINVTAFGNVTATVVVGSTTAPYYIRTVIVDNDPDVQRRRSDKLLATSQSVAAIA